MNRNDLKRALCRLIPIRDRRVVFSSYAGRGYGDSPKAICEALHRRDPGLDLCWLVNGEGEAKTLPPYVRPIPNRGWKKLHALASARVWVDNCRKWENVKGPGQYYLQTWHGFGPKQVEADAERVLDPAYVASAKTDSAQCDLIVSGSRYMTDLYHRAFWYSGPVEETGTPRCDVFFTDLTPVREKVLRYYGLPGDRKLLLYAPTFREDRTRTDCYALDAEKVRRACEDRFGGAWTVMLRLHSNASAYSKNLFPYDGDRILDVTAYPDMQELLCAVDVLITDYSSSMLDFPLAKQKPCFRFALDLEAYLKERELNLLDVLPFSLAQSNEDLARDIRSFDEEAYRSRWETFVRQVGLCEDGRASERAADWILSKMKKNRT